MINISRELYPYRCGITSQQRQSYDPETGLNLTWAWCVERFGHPREDRRWNFDTHMTFMFRDERDYILFILRWS